jgi:hypothetical protein
VSELVAIKSYGGVTMQDNFLFQKIMRNKHICKLLLAGCWILTSRMISATQRNMWMVMNLLMDLMVEIDSEEAKVYDFCIGKIQAIGKQHALASENKACVLLVKIGLLRRKCPPAMPGDLFDDSFMCKYEDYRIFKKFLQRGPYLITVGFRELPEVQMDKNVVKNTC